MITPEVIAVETIDDAYRVSRARYLAALEDWLTAAEEVASARALYDQAWSLRRKEGFDPDVVPSFLEPIQLSYAQVHRKLVCQSFARL